MEFPEGDSEGDRACDTYLLCAVRWRTLGGWLQRMCAAAQTADANRQSNAVNRPQPMLPMPEPTAVPREDAVSLPAPLAAAHDFAEGRDDPQQAEELERQQDA
jgi:hypothetical protein